MLPGLEHFNNSQKLIIRGLIPYFDRNHLLEEKNHRMPLAQIIGSELTEYFTNHIAKYIYFNSNMTFQAKITYNWSFYKCLSLFNKGSSSIKSEERLWLDTQILSSGCFFFFSLDLVFWLRYFLTFLAFITFLYYHNLYLNSLPGFFDHLTLNFYLLHPLKSLDLLLRLFLI